MVNPNDPIDGFIMWLLLRIVIVCLLIGAVAYCTGAHAGVVTACTHDAAPPTPLFDREQDARIEAWKAKQEARDELCDAVPALKYLPYALRFQRGQWDFRFYLFLKGDFKWSS